MYCITLTFFSCPILPVLGIQGSNEGLWDKADWSSLQGFKLDVVWTDNLDTGRDLHLVDANDWEVFLDKAEYELCGGLVVEWDILPLSETNKFNFLGHDENLRDAEERIKCRYTYFFTNILVYLSIKYFIKILKEWKAIIKSFELQLRKILSNQEKY